MSRERRIELKSLKFYIQAYRSVGIHHESGVNRILDDLVNACAPRKTTLIELKSLKFYIQAYRSVGIHHESGVNRILDDLVNACAPRKMEVVGDFSVRGGIKTVVRTAYESRE